MTQKLDLHLPSDLYSEIDSYIRSEGISFEQFALWSLSEKVGEIRERRQVKNLKYLKPAQSNSSLQRFLPEERSPTPPSTPTPTPKPKPEDKSPAVRGPKPLLTAAEAAEILGISKSKMYNMMQARQIPVITLGRNVRIREEDIEEFIVRQRRQSYPGA
jgi:excisionase family DNA binding protein